MSIRHPRSVVHLSAASHSGFCAHSATLACSYLLEWCTMRLAQWCPSEGWPLKPVCRGWCTTGWVISTLEVMEESISTVLSFKCIVSEFSYIKPSKRKNCMQCMSNRHTSLSPLTNVSEVNPLKGHFEGDCLQNILLSDYFGVLGSRKD